MDPRTLVESMFEELASSDPADVAARYMSEDLPMEQDGFPVREVARPGDGGGLTGVLQQVGVKLPGA